MRDEKAKQPSQADADLEREIRKGRKFTLAEAIGRVAGAGAMKAARPMSRHQQAEVEIENYLRGHLPDAAGILPLVLYRRVKVSQLLLDNYDQPLLVLACCVQKTLDSAYLLAELVRDADTEWGRVF